MAEIFFGELDAYFLDVIPQVIKDNELNSVPCRYHLAEPEGTPDFKDALITFFSYDMLEDKSRLQSYNPIELGRENGLIHMTDQPEPYKLYYQFDLWSEWNEDIVTMLPQFQRLFPPRGSIMVPDSEGNEVELFMKLVQFKNADSRLRDDALKHTERDRFFRKILRYAVHTELSSNKIKTYHEVTEVNPDVTEGGNVNEDGN